MTELESQCWNDRFEVYIKLHMAQQTGRSQGPPRSPLSLSKHEALNLFPKMNPNINKRPWYLISVSQ